MRRTPPARAAASVGALRSAARRMNGVLVTYRALLDPVWADDLRTELSWLAGVVAREYACADRLERLSGALHRLASGPAGSGEGTGPAAAEAGGRTPGAPGGGRRSAGGGAATRERGALPVGAARAGALLERRLTLARTPRTLGRAPGAGLGPVPRAVADAVALLASETPFRPGGDAGRPAAAMLAPPAEQARRRLDEAVAALPLTRAGAPYNADGLSRSLGVEARQDAAWDHVRVLLRVHRYAQEVLGPHAVPDPRLRPAGEALERHHEAAAAAAAAAASAAATPPHRARHRLRPRRPARRPAPRGGGRPLRLRPPLDPHPPGERPFLFLRRLSGGAPGANRRPAASRRGGRCQMRVPGMVCGARALQRTVTSPWRQRRGPSASGQSAARARTARIQRWRALRAP